MNEPHRLRVGVLASGAGTNLQAILDRVHGKEADVVAVGSDKPGAEALGRALGLGIAAREFPASEYADREARDLAIAEWLVEQDVELVVLAGYMQLVSAAFLAAFPLRVINVHPALLPAFPGIRAVEQAVAYGVKVFGVTVHLVDEGVDSGSIIAQEAVPLPQAPDAETGHGARRPVRHRVRCAAVRAVAAGVVGGDPRHPRRIRVGREGPDRDQARRGAHPAGAAFGVRQDGRRRLRPRARGSRSG